MTSIAQRLQELGYPDSQAQDLAGAAHPGTCGPLLQRGDLPHCLAAVKRLAPRLRDACGARHQ